MLLLSAVALFVIWVLWNHFTAKARFPPPIQPNEPAKVKKHVGIIGCGVSGLLLMKELREKGHTFECYEMLGRLGGVFAKTYDNATMTSGSMTTGLSYWSDGKDAEPTVWSCDQYVTEQLDRMAAELNLLEHVKFQHRVDVVRRAGDGKYELVVQPDVACKPHRLCPNPKPADPNAQAFVRKFDQIIVCTGTHRDWQLPVFPGQEKFKGTIIHSADYVNAEPLAGKRVLTIGGGESGADITLQIARVAAKTAICIRGHHGHLIPRWLPKGSGHHMPTDVNTSRLRYTNPLEMGVAGATTLLKYRRWHPRLQKNKVLQKMIEYNLDNKSCAFTKFGCKNTSFVEAILHHGCERKPAVKEFKEDRVIFVDGSEFMCDAVVCNTGYQNSFPLLEENFPELAKSAVRPRGMFKHIIDADFGTDIMFMGFARPAFGSVPAIAENQARFIARVVSEEQPLPDKAGMQAVIKADAEDYTRRFPMDAERLPTLVDFMLYNDAMAEQLKTGPPMWDIFWSSPSLWWKMHRTALTNHQYRLRGVGNDPERALRILKALPKGPPVESIIFTVTLLYSLFNYHILRRKQFKPNNMFMSE